MHIIGAQIARRCSCVCVHVPETTSVKVPLGGGCIREAFNTKSNFYRLLAVAE